MKSDTYTYSDADRARSTSETLVFLKKGNAPIPSVSTVPLQTLADVVTQTYEAARKDLNPASLAEVQRAAAIVRDAQYGMAGRKKMKLMGFNESLMRDITMAGAQR